MSISIVIDDKVKFRVKGCIRNGGGADQPFDFGLLCKRLSTDEIDQQKTPEGAFVYADFMASVIEDWYDVKGADKQALPYSPEAWQGLCKMPGVAALAWGSYMRENGAKEKN